MSKSDRNIFVEFVLSQRTRRALGKFDVYAETERDTGEGAEPNDGKRSVSLDLKKSQMDLISTECPEIRWAHKFRNRDGDLIVDRERDAELVVKRRAWMGMHGGKMGRKLRLTYHLKYADGLSPRVFLREYHNGKLIRQKP